MANSNATKKALFMSMLSLLLCFTMLMGATFAWFTDTVTSKNNRIVAGNLKIDLLMDKTESNNYVSIAEPENDQARGDIFSEKTGNGINWEPGKTEIVYLAVQNQGSLALKYNIVVNVVDEGLAGALQYTILDGKKAADLAAATKWADIVAAGAPVAQVEAGTFVAKNGVLDEIKQSNTPDETEYFALAVHMKEDAGNEYQTEYNEDGTVKNAKAVKIDVQVLATQVEAEEDSFGPEYDENADFDGQISTYSALTAALAKGGNYEVKADITVPEGESITVLEGVTLALNLGGNTITSSSSGAVVTNNGTLTIAGNGTITNTAVNGGAVINNSGTLTLDGATIVGAPIGSTGYPAYAVTTSGKLIVEDGTTISADRGGISTSAGADVVINGGKVTVSDAADGRNMTLHTIYAYGGSATLVINDGYFEMGHTSTGGASVICPAGAAITINGGDFRDAMDDTNWTSTGNFQNYMGYSAPVKVYGGTFDDKTVEKNLADGALIIDNGDGTFKVITVPEGAVAVSNSTDLSNAIKNASATEENTFVLASGTYDNNIKLTLADQGTQKGDIVFKAAEGANVVFTGTTTLGYRNQGTGATMWNGNVTFEGITFDHANAATHSLDVQDVKSLTLKNCTIIGDGEFGMTSARGNGTGPSKIIGCKFENAGAQLLGNFATGLVIDDCDFKNSCINVQAGNSVTVQNCRFDSTLTNANLGESFYLVRSNSTPITVKNCKVKVDSTVTGVATAQAKWGMFWNRGTTNWTVSDVEITMTAAAEAQTELLVTKCTSTGVINTSNLTVNGVAQ